MEHSIARRYPVGVQDFAKIREEGFVYVDKTRLVYELANHNGDALFLSRPRRFGKSLLCSTLKYYFLGRKELFEGLDIARLEQQWRQHPVLHFDMSQAKREVPIEVRTILSGKLADYEKIYGTDPTKQTLGDRLEWLVKEAHRQTGERTVLIFDEYDSPMLEVIDRPDALREVRTILTEFYGPVKTMGEHLRFVFLTGITKFSQMSIFSAINNLANISMSAKAEAVCGITGQELTDNFGPEIEMLARRYHVTADEMLAQLRHRYDGYHFSTGMTDIYNPFSLMRTFELEQVGDHWFGSATPSALLKVLRNYPFTLENLDDTEAYESLFDQPFDNYSSAIPILYQSGYLTIKDCRLSGFNTTYTLGIPNQEVRNGLYNTMLEHYVNPNPLPNQSLVMQVARAMRRDDIEAALTAVKAYMSSIPYDLRGRKELGYERDLRIIFECIGMEIDTEVKNAIGRCDVVMRTPAKVYVIELKTDEGGTVDRALAQIDEKNYLIPYRNDVRPKVKVGVVIDHKTRTLGEWKIVEKISN